MTEYTVKDAIRSEKIVFRWDLRCKKTKHHYKEIRLIITEFTQVKDDKGVADAS